jgi:hypothetical protein
MIYGFRLQIAHTQTTQHENDDRSAASSTSGIANLPGNTRFAIIAAFPQLTVQAYMVRMLHEALLSQGKVRITFDMDI